jgi:hypothetical protein
MFFRRVTKTAQKGLKIGLIISMSKSYAPRFLSPVGTANSKQKNYPKRAVFLLKPAHIRVKTGLKNSYALRVPLSGIFERTRDLGT